MEKHNIKKFYNGRKIFIAGGDGFIGSHLAERLFELGSLVSVFAHPQSSFWRLENIKKDIEIIRCDLVDGKKVTHAVTRLKPDIIFNTSGSVLSSAPISAFSKLLESDFFVTLNLLQAAGKAGSRRFVHTGTIAEYGVGKTPFTEIQKELPNTPYAVSKNLASNAVLALSKSFGVEAVVIRPAATFGPKQAFGIMLVPNIIQSCLIKKDFYMHSGKQLRDFIFVQDVVDGFLAAGYSKKAAGEIFNLGSGKGYSVKHVASAVNDCMGKPITIHFGTRLPRSGEPEKFFMNSKKAEKILGWKAKTSFRDALNKTVEWYKNNYSSVSKE